MFLAVTIMKENICFDRIKINSDFFLDANFNLKMDFLIVRKTFKSQYMKCR